MRKIGLTGGIGSGKSTVAEIFRVLGVPVFNSDIEAKALLSSDANVMSGVKALFGNDIYENGSPDRKRIAAIVFGNEEKLAALNQVVHPAVAKRFSEFCEANSKAEYVVKEAAILIEIGDTSVDEMLLITAPEESRVVRVMRRDGVGEVSVRQRIKEQMNDEEKLKKADHVIVNDGEHSLIEAVLALHQRFTS